MGMSATSSRSSVPPWACSSVPTLVGPSARSPRVSLPKSSTSRRSARMAAQLMTTKGPLARLDSRCRSRAATSLPQPAGPTISTRLPVGATRSICWREWLTAGDWPNSSYSSPAQLRGLHGTLDDQQQAIGLEGLLDEVIGPELDGLNRRLDVAVAADHDDGQ